MMQQWHVCKEKAKEALLLFRLGDFYEAFYEDAKILAQDLELTLTKRSDIPMSGIPAHTLDSYLEKLIEKGHVIAIAEQTEDPKSTKGLVKREIVRWISPGTVYQTSALSEKKHNFFASLCSSNMRFGIAFVDITTADCKVVEVTTLSQLQEELFRLQPAELLIGTKTLHNLHTLCNDLQTKCGTKITSIEDWHFDATHARRVLLSHCKVHSLDGFGLKDSLAALMAAGTLFSYLQDTLSLSLSHVTSLERYHLGDYMAIDPITEKHLEIFSSTQGKKISQHTLLYLMDQTVTPMGSRLLRDWIARPLLDKTAINARLDATEELLHFSELATLHTLCSSIRDIERLIMRITTNHGTPRDIAALFLSLTPLPKLLELTLQLHHPLFHTIATLLCDVSALTQNISATLETEPPIRLGEGNVIKEGVSAELDELRLLKADSHAFLMQYQERLRQETQLKTLKVGFNKAFGYFIELSRNQAEKVPLYFHKRQTLVNNERFITEELREYENKILHADERISQLESSLYQELKAFVSSFEAHIRSIAKGVAHIDCLLSWTALAKRKGYTRPSVDESHSLVIKEGRHPVIEASFTAESFIPNDTEMDDENQTLYLITGPNMAGKSTYIRQVALLCMMAQMGAFVPASYAHIGIIDKIFSRIGASDDLSRGQSTFMVEMTETANILRHATHKSLIILDEIGRGTSTYDGIAIAWSVAEYLLTHPGKQAKTLFATHYSELTALESRFPRAKNYSIAVQETSQGIVFLHQIVRGGADKSYGIHVAKLAGLPSEVIIKATSMLKSLENKSFQKKSTQNTSEQLSLFTERPDKTTTSILEALKKVDVSQTTPMQALTLLSEWQSSILN